ncbi:unnamed protein product [Acanthoscelides obtectus]|uniref:Uncharacterized protein n=1 Tax=Acanthoscelides obtectus TaxID=200917 RepID=A0A9P0JJ55_ACAOB|nr:unnamed protein product [Acanthoscelides obtectus]CAK1639919.1 hypothetical protein AOBTE_LOCUS11451 [Acanthoscelides obtectus]
MDEIKLKSFPKDFIFGVSTSAYQIEGGYDADGKGENIWDHYTNKYPKLFKNANGNIACDSYTKFREDVALVDDLGVDFYRFSVSWSRILPNGHCNVINEKGIQYYNNIIDALTDKGIQPMITMFHWDLPMPLQRLGGWTNPLIVQWFKDYARILFSRFGDRVKLWVTVNKSETGYCDDGFPPFINQPGIADYLLNHHTLLAHAETYHMYKEEFLAKQHGKVQATYFWIAILLLCFDILRGFRGISRQNPSTVILKIWKPKRKRPSARIVCIKHLYLCHKISSRVTCINF